MPPFRVVDKQSTETEVSFDEGATAMFNKILKQKPVAVAVLFEVEGKTHRASFPSANCVEVGLIDAAYDLLHAGLDE